MSCELSRARLLSCVCLVSFSSELILSSTIEAINETWFIEDLQQMAVDTKG